MYALLLRLYPSRFRDEFGEEMKSVLAESLEEAAAKTRWATLSVFVREVWDLPGMLLRMYWDGFRERRKELTMSTAAVQLPGMNVRSVGLSEKPATWVESIAAMIPFLLYPLAMAIAFVLDLVKQLLRSPDSNWIIVISYVLWMILGGITIVLAASWIKGFPCWSFPFWSLGLLLYLLFLPSASTPGLVFFNYTFGRNDLWGWRSFIPVLLALSGGLLWTRSLRPLIQLVRRVWGDWTLVSFAWYAWLVLVVPIFMDEIRGADGFQITLSALLALGALVYMRSAGPERRMLPLLAVFAVVWTAATIYKAVYWSEPSLYAMAWVTPVPWEQTVTQMSQAGATIAAIMCAPLLLGLTRRAVNATVKR